jgi:uncharacterized protein (DUF302 family)
MSEERCSEIIEMAEGPSVCAHPGEESRTPPAVLEESAYGIKMLVDKPFEDTLASTRRALSDEGLSVVSEMDVRGTMEGMLGTEYPSYTILGTCSPALLREVLEKDKDMGLLLPLNVVVYAHSGGTVVEAIDPIAQFSVAGDHGVRDIAVSAKRKLQDVIDRIASGRD